MYGTKRYGVSGDRYGVAPYGAGFNPLQLDLMLWLSPSARATVIDNDGDPASGGSFNGNLADWVDSTGNSRDASAAGAAMPTWADNIVTTVTDDVMRISDFAFPTYATLSCFVWVKATAAGTYIFCQNDDNDDRAFAVLGDAGGEFRVIISDDGTFDAGHKKLYVSSLIALDNTWHFIGFTFNAGVLKLYVDGTLDPNPTKTFDDAITTIHDGAADLTIAARLDTDVPEKFFEGDLADIYMESEVWSLEKIQKFYRFGR